jgi:hypothetical protein
MKQLDRTAAGNGVTFTPTPTTTKILTTIVG